MGKSRKYEGNRLNNFLYYLNITVLTDIDINIMLKLTKKYTFFKFLIKSQNGFVEKFFHTY